MTSTMINNRRLLEALDYIDDDLIAEVTDNYEIFDQNTGAAMSPRAKRKFYAKIAAAAACLVLVAGLMSAAPAIWNELKMIIPGSSNTELYENYIPTQEELDIINDYWLKEQKSIYAQTPEEAAAKKSYFGKYGDCLIIYFAWDAAADNEDLLIDEYMFSFGASEFLAFHGSKILNIKEAYEAGAFSKNDLMHLGEKFIEFKNGNEKVFCRVGEEYSFSPVSAPVSLTYAEICEILIARIPNWKTSEAIYSLRCYGKFGDIYAVCINDNLYTEYDVTTTETVGNYTFEYPDNRKNLLIYKGGEFYSVTEAYENGLIGNDILQTLASDFAKYSKSYPVQDIFHRWFYSDSYSDFSDNEIVVNLIPKTDGSDYTAEDFAFINCTDIEEFNENRFSAPGETYKITLSEHSLKNICNVLNELSKNPNVMSLSMYREN